MTTFINIRDPYFSDNWSNLLMNTIKDVVEIVEISIMNFIKNFREVKFSCFVYLGKNKNSIYAVVLMERGRIILEN